MGDVLATVGVVEMKPFFALFNVMPGFVWALLLACALALIGVKQVQLGAARTTAAEARADLAIYKAQAAESARLAELDARREEIRRNDLQRKAIDEAAAQVDTAQADAAAARDAAGQLRQQAQRAADAARAARADSAALGASAAAFDPIGMLADVLGRIDQRASRLAEIADAARIAGNLCERSYDALVSTTNAKGQQL
ncbi:MAG: DUF2514 family protein [Burkholderiales bacterium]|nr:MAG: DUF2514 family protein [Burkholderiales bacterium]